VGSYNSKFIAPYSCEGPPCSFSPPSPFLSFISCFPCFSFSYVFCWIFLVFPHRATFFFLFLIPDFMVCEMSFFLSSIFGLFSCWLDLCEWGEGGLIGG